MVATFLQSSRSISISSGAVDAMICVVVDEARSSPLHHSRKIDDDKFLADVDFKRAEFIEFRSLMSSLWFPNSKPQRSRSLSASRPLSGTPVNPTRPKSYLLEDTTTPSQAIYSTIHTLNPSTTRPKHRQNATRSPTNDNLSRPRLRKQPTNNDASSQLLTQVYRSTLPSYSVTHPSQRKSKMRLFQSYVQSSSSRMR